MENKEKENDRRLLPSKIESTLQYFDFEGMNNQDIVEKYEETLMHREQQLKQLSKAIGVLNEKIVHATECNALLFEEIDKLKKENATKDILLGKELKNKELMFEQLNSLYFEHLRMKKVLKTYEQIIQDQHKDSDETIKDEYNQIGQREMKPPKEIEIEIEKEKENEYDILNNGNQPNTNHKPRPNVIQSEINPSKNIDSLFGRVMDRLIGAYETYVTGDEGTGEIGDANTNDNQEENVMISDHQITKDKDNKDEDKDDNNQQNLYLNIDTQKIKKELDEILNFESKPETKSDNKEKINDYKDKEKEKDLQQTEEMTTLKDEAKVNPIEIIKEMKEKEKEIVPQNGTLFVTAESDNQEIKPSIKESHSENREEIEGDSKQIEPNQEETTESKSVVSIQHSKQETAEIKAIENLITVPTQTDKEVKSNPILEETLQTVEEEAKPSEINAKKESKEESNPQQSPMNNEVPESKQEEKKTGKRKKVKKKPKGLSSQALDSDSLTYEPFFK